MTHGINHSAKCFELFDGEAPVAFIGVLNQPNKELRNLRRVSRLVVLPDYQGVGIGGAFLDAIGELYSSNGLALDINTSARNIISKLRRGEKWRPLSYGYTRIVPKQVANFGWAARNTAKTASFRYVGGGTEVEKALRGDESLSKAPIFELPSN